MKYFTPELYRRFSSSNRAEVIKAHEEWERAIESYRQHLDEIGPRMVGNARTLAETLYLHDADYIRLSLLPTPDAGKPLAVLLVRQEESRVFLFYLLAEGPLTKEADLEWPFSPEQVHWLYDEFDIDECGVQQHEVMLSNGQIIRLRFHEMQILRHNIQEPALAST